MQKKQLSFTLIRGIPGLTSTVPYYFPDNLDPTAKKWLERKQVTKAQTVKKKKLRRK